MIGEMGRVGFCCRCCMLARGGWGLIGICVSGFYGYVSLGDLGVKARTSLIGSRILCYRTRFYTIVWISYVEPQKEIIIVVIRLVALSSERVREYSSSTSNFTSKEKRKRKLYNSFKVSIKEHFNYGFLS